ncbi:MAG: hypothetical protein OEZ39_20280 [Gammaproteobacteria bacterium]|nr:hypothetical protein [Gammaproteobacteria bacterium]
MAELMLVNPGKRGGKKTGKRASKRSGKRSGKAMALRKRNPMAANPKKRGRYRRRNPAGRRGFNLKTIFKNQVIPAATAGAGAVVLDVGYGFLPIPENLKMGPMRHVVKGAAAIGLGMLAGMVVKKPTAEQLATGALTTVFHQAYRDLLAQFAPQIALGVYETELQGLGVYDESLGYVTPPSLIDNDELLEMDGLGQYDEDVYGMGETYDMEEMEEF